MKAGELAVGTRLGWSACGCVFEVAGRDPDPACHHHVVFRQVYKCDRFCDLNKGQELWLFEDQPIAGEPGRHSFLLGRDVPYDTVCFASSFARESSPNVTHITINGRETLCKRRGWETTEGWRPDLVACSRCSAVYEKLGRPYWSDMDASVLDVIG